jgi:iron complex outermembrane recepter protein
MTLSGQFSVVQASSLADGKPLAFVPAGRVRGAVTYHPPTSNWLGKSFVTINGTLVDRQRRTTASSDFAPPPAGYFVLGAELGTKTKIAGHGVNFALSGTNLLNARYRDYTSLLRYFADEPGWQVSFRMSAHFGAARSDATQE